MENKYFSSTEDVKNGFFCELLHHIVNNVRISFIVSFVSLHRHM